MINKFNRSICKKCRRIFVNQNNNYLCNTCLENNKIDEYWEKVYKSNPKNCEKCGKLYYKPYKKNLCINCKEIGNADTSKSKLKENKYLKLNKNWIEEKDLPTMGKKYGKRISLERLIKNQEFKRVYGKKAWDHYEKGRKWDKI